MKTYVFKVVVEPDEDRWFADCPALKNNSGATWGYTKEEALKNIQQVVQKEEQWKEQSKPSSQME